MPQKTSSVIRDEIIEKYLYGMNQDEIAKTTGTSEANVSHIIREFKITSSQKEVEVFVTLTRVLNAENISHIEIIPAVRIYNIIQQLGLNIDDKTMPSFLSGIYKEAKSNGIEPKILVEIAMRMLKLKPHDIPLENMPKYYEDLMIQVKSKEEKLEELKKELVQNEEKKIRTDKEVRIKLDEAEITIDTLEEYQTNKKALEDMGVSINDIPKISNMLNQASISGYDVSKITEFTTKEGSFEDRRLQLEEILKQLLEQEKLLKSNIEKLENTIEITKSDIEDLEKTAGELQNSINLIHYMKKQGVDPTQIIQWERILKSSGIKLQQFEDELQKFGSITAYTTNKRSELQTLEKEITNKKSRVKTLTNEQIRLESSIDEIQKTTVKYLEIVGKKSIDSILIAESASKESIRSVANKMGEEMKKMSNMTHEELQNLISILADFISQVTVASEEVGRMYMLHAMSDIINKSEGDPYDVYPSFISLLEKFKKWLESQKADRSTISSIENFIRYLKNEEEKIGITA